MWSQRLSGRPDWAILADRLERLVGTGGGKGPPFARAERALDELERAAADTSHRSSLRHPSTGIPTREPLLHQMRTDAHGLLGIIRFLDFDRLCAFDPLLAEQLLQKIAARLQAMLPPQRFLAQVDRSHLAIWFGPGTSETLARSEMEAIEYAMREALPIGEHTIIPKSASQITAVRGTDPEPVLTRCLARLAVATSSTAMLPKDDSDTAERDDFALEQDLALAISRGELSLCYQPIVDAQSARVCGGEALIRWHHPKRGSIPPALFVPVMEAVGLAHEFGMWALNTAARDARSWQAHGLENVRVAVNVSGHQLERDDLPTLVARTLRRHNLSPSALEIELTESVAMVDCGRAAQLFADIRAMGVGISIDDFGTGYSSLSTLRTLAFDKIKIDREFVTDVHRRKDSQAICLSIIALARGLGIRVLAEGVETPDEYLWLRRQGCNLYQGYYFSVPLVAAEFIEFVQDSAPLVAKLNQHQGSDRPQIVKRLSA